MMHTIQRWLSLAAMLVLLLILPVLYRMDDREREQYHKAEELVDSLHTLIEKKGELTYKEYLWYFETLVKLNAYRQLLLYEYQREEGTNGSVHWYLITWEEIEEALIVQGSYRFQNQSAYKIISSTMEKKTTWKRLLGTDEAIMYGGRIFR